TTTPTKHILILGAGTFGLSTALHLLQRHAGTGKVRVTVLDRAAELPARDAASVDLNKVVRSCYTDKFYTRLAREAIAAWKAPEWAGCYHESGILLLKNTTTSPDVDPAYANDRALGARTSLLPDAAAVRAALGVEGAFPAPVPFDPTTPTPAYTASLNHDGGWAEAARAMRVLLARVRAAGGRVLGGREARGVVRRAGRCVGVRVWVGAGHEEVYEADVVVLAVGAWTASAFRELGLDARCLATGQSVATIQLTPDEAALYRDCPVFLNFETGFYVFPPNEDNIVKFALHAAGHTHPTATPCSHPPPTTTVAPTPPVPCIPPAPPPRGISTPRTVLSHPDGGDGLRIPRSVARELREHLRDVYPRLAEKPFLGTRLCWYTDSPDSDWVIGAYPGDPSLFLATSGSGHAFKFLPIIGSIVADAIEGKLDPAIAKKFAVDRAIAPGVLAERNTRPIRELDLAELCLPEDLLP
ncbi:FAD dependent oxidoreductase, partial [Leucogyrophana mollusca]